MMPTYAPALLDEIRTGVDLVELVGRVVNLKKAGVNWKGLCPFHGEKTPSFTVNPQRGIFHCFGCGVGGDAFGFLMRQDRLSFPEAVRALAKLTGVALPEDEARRPGESGRDDLLKAMALAASFFAERLWAPGGDRARRYLEGRGIAPDVAKRFGLGLAPEGWESLHTALRAERVADETLVSAGLVVPRQGGNGSYDRFRDRLIFPIRDLQGRVVAFGGRAFGDEQPKYLNSPETPLYTKGHLLYAVDLAREPMRERQRTLLVEGYVDCLMAHQHGFTETVAALGTAFTAAQLALLRRLTGEVVTFFDADAAGRKAAERAEELLEPTAAGGAWAINRSGSFEGAGTLRVKVALLPAGHDPDTFLRTEGATAFAERIDGARSLLSYALDRAIVDPEGATGPRARTQGFARAALLLAKVADAEEAATLSREAATKLGVDPTQLWIEAQKLQAALSRPARPAQPVAAFSTPASTTRERDLVAFLTHCIEARPALLPLIDEGDIRNEGLRTIVAALKQRPHDPAETLMSDLPNDSARSTLAALLVGERGPEDQAALTEEFTKHLEREQRLKRQREARQRIADAQTTGTSVPVEEQLRAFYGESKTVYEAAGGVAQALPHRPGVPQGVDTND
jgi:DNA primase